MDILSNLLFHIERSQKAYEYYLKDKRYYQALRIFRANEKIYSLITDNAYLWDEEIKELIYQYIFHLEDWFEQFRFLEKKQPDLTDAFIFERLNGSPSFPKGIVDKLKAQQ
jgi:hypothetical protein